MHQRTSGAPWWAGFLVTLIVFGLAGCAAPAQEHAAGNAADAAAAATPHADEEHTDEEHAADEHAEDEHAEGVVHVDDLAAVALGADEKLQVVATTNIVADVVAQVGGDAIELTALVPAGADPHSYQPRPADLRTLDDAHVLFINGYGLEEAMASIFESLETTAVVAVNEEVTLREFADTDHDSHEHGDQEHGDDEHSDTEHSGEEHAGEADEHEHGSIDPHTWMAVPSVQSWVNTIERALATLDPARAEQYAANAAAYRAELDALDAEIRAELDTIPAERRKLVTDHASFGYFADAYDFETIGAVIPGLSTLATPSAQQLAALQDQLSDAGVPAIFVGTTVNPQLAERLATDLGIRVVPIYTGSLSDADGPAASYLEFMRYNARVLAENLRAE